MPRYVSFAVLICILLLIGFLFFKVMSLFLLPLFLAVLLAVIFRPLHERILARCGSYTKLAGGITTVITLVIVLLPTTWIVIRAGREAASIGNQINQKSIKKQFGRGMEQLREFSDRLGFPLASDDELAALASAQLQALLGPLAIESVHFVAQFLFGFIIVIVALYFFLVDGPGMIEEMLRLSPLDARHAQQLIQQFGNVSRAVVIASLLSALAQGVLAGVAFVIVGFPLAFLLTALTMLLAMIPFLGAAAVWIPACLWLYFHDERPVAAILLTIYCALVVSLIDNLIKPLVLHGHSNLHPLLALLSVLGGVTALGPIGILVGPLAVSFLQALLVMLRTEIDEMSADPAQAATESPQGGQPQAVSSAATPAPTSASPAAASQPPAKKETAAGA